MDQLHSSSNVNTYTGDRDVGKPWGFKRGEKLVRMRIECRIPNKQAGSHLLSKGVNEVDLRANEAEEVLRLAAYWMPPEESGPEFQRIREMFPKCDGNEARRVADAVEECQQEIYEELRETHRPDLGGIEFREHLDEVVAKGHDSRSADEKLLIDDLETLKQKTGWSPEKCFFKRHHRGISPFPKAEVIDDSIKAPVESRDSSEAELVLTSALKALGATGGAETVKLLRELKDRIEAQDAEIARLKQATAGVVAAHEPEGEDGDEKDPDKKPDSLRDHLGKRRKG